MYDSDIKHPSPSLEAKLRKILNFGHSSTDLDLAIKTDYLGLLKELGNPHLHLPPVVHIAGTNGKGSTLAIMRSILQQAGLKVHVYTSPHLVRFNERIVLAGQVISDDMLESLIDEALAINEGAPLSFFEFTTAIAFTAFARTDADIILLETGLGGRLDCTNVVPNPTLTIITPVGLDHQDYLGNSLGEIAAEKAGIMKQGRPCVIAKQQSDAMDVLVKHAADFKCQTFIADDDWAHSPAANDQMRWTWRSKATTYPRPALSGHHQIDNAGTALAAIRVLGDILPINPISDKDIAAGLKSVQWPARMQDISALAAHKPYSAWRIWLDGGHNADAARALCAQMKRWRDDDPECDIHIICAMMKHKDAAAFLTPLSEAASSITAVPVALEGNAMKSEDLVKALPDLDILTRGSYQDAISNIFTSYGDRKGHILICGSLYLAGDVLRSLS